MKSVLLVIPAWFAGFAVLHLAHCAESDSSAITPSTVPASDSPIVFESGTERVALVELFTSQGCSSCPPADTFLSKKIRDKDLWKKFVPVAWHVAYWDRLGWTDPFGSDTHTRRQYAHNKAGNVASVYTPGFVIDGKEWRGFFARQDLPEAAKSSVAPPNLKVTVDGSTVALEVIWTGTAPVSATGWTLHLVELGFGLKTDINRGENSGRILVNDFVALEHQTADLERGKTKVEIELPAKKESHEAVHPAHRALAVWLTQTGKLAPIQATGSWLPNGY